MFYARLGALGMALAVMFGAFGAHALRGRLDAYSLDVFQKAVFYHFLHAMGLLVVPLFVKAGALKAEVGVRVCALLAAGIILFSWSLYGLALSGWRTLGAVTPFGGTAFIAAWLYLAWGLFQGRRM
jgi:uncharacterized membrane protein YgdD (TMEM256/DUF423 family)